MSQKITRKAIAVYNPSDPWESAIQDAAKDLTGNWLPSFPCQLLAKAVASLKVGSDWLTREDLLPVRAHYLFAPYLSANKESLVFVTHLLFLRDILENREISSILYDPIVLMAEELATFLFRDSPVHLYINENMLKAANPHAQFLDVGGFLICYDGNINLEDGVLTNFRYHGSEMEQGRISQLIHDIKEDQGLSFSKAAAKEIAPDVFRIDEHFPELTPDTEVWDKITRSTAQISAIEKSENGIVHVLYPDGNEITVPKQEFDQQFVVV